MTKTILIDGVMELETQAAGPFLRFNVFLGDEDNDYLIIIGMRLLKGRILPPQLRAGVKYFPLAYLNTNNATGLKEALALKLREEKINHKYPFHPKPEQVIHSLLIGKAKSRHLPTIFPEVVVELVTENIEVITLEDEEAGNIPWKHVYSQAYMKKHPGQPVK